MSIRLIAQELYQLIKEVEILEKRIREAAPEKKESLQFELLKLKAERNRMRDMLEGSKD